MVCQSVQHWARPSRIIWSRGHPLLNLDAGICSRSKNCKRENIGQKHRGNYRYRYCTRPKSAVLVAICLRINKSESERAIVLFKLQLELNNNIQSKTLLLLVPEDPMSLRLFAARGKVGPQSKTSRMKDAIYFSLRSTSPHAQIHLKGVGAVARSARSRHLYSQCRCFAESEIVFPSPLQLG